MDKKIIFLQLLMQRSVFGAVLLLGSAVVVVPTASAQPDWLESYNRAVFDINHSIDQNVLKPIAEGYKNVTPEPIDRGISNFFSNLGDLVVVANDLMQLKFDQALSDTNRFVINSTFGMLGIFDLATPMGLPKHDEDFGQTLGYWGVGEGYFFILPLLGPTTMRDVVGLPVDAIFHPINYVDPFAARTGARALELVDFRADLLGVEKALGDAALDPYLFQRETYLQRRRSLVADGNLPDQEQSEDDLFDQLDELESDPAAAQ